MSICINCDFVSAGYGYDVYLTAGLGVVMWLGFAYFLEETFGRYHERRRDRIAAICLWAIGIIVACVACVVVLYVMGWFAVHLIDFVRNLL